MLDQIRFFAGAARVLEGRSAGEYMAGHTSWIRREPIGVVAQVTPWNYPLMMAVWKIAPALAAGNTVVLKPSDTTPVTTLMLAEVAGEIYPPGVLNVICGDRDTGRSLVSHPVPQLVAITGSVRAGREVATAAAADIKRVHLELGGKAPVIVFDDADVEKAAEAIAIAGYFNAGQDCTAATRVLAAPRSYGDMVDALAEQARATTFGGLDQPDVAFGPLNNASQLERVRGMVARTPTHAQVVAGGEAPGGPGYLLPPDGDRRRRAVRRAGPVGDLRAGHHRAALQRRGPGGGLGQRRRIRAGLERVDPGPRAGHAGVPAAGLRLRLDQHPHPARGRDAPRRLQAFGLRQGPVDVRSGGLHPHQARHEQHRLEEQR